MMKFHFEPSILVFLASIAATLLVVERGRQDAKTVELSSLSEQRLNKWLVGLSAGAAANSGFVVTGAVGLGYLYGARWLLLPLAWLLGDLIFWSHFPHRINSLGAATKATTMTDVVVSGMAPRAQAGLRRLVGIISIICLGGYVSAQWLAGEKFLRGAFGFSDSLSLLAFAILIVFYTAVGGFRGSVYADAFQACVRIVGTIIAISAVIWIGYRSQDAVWHNLHTASPHFLQIISYETLWSSGALVLGYACASLGFGLGQPQMVTRYLAGASPTETQSAWWIYIGFVQFTWILMTLFGILLRGVMPHISDPEMGLSIFHHANTGPIITGLISADIFATIAAASNSLLVAMAQIVTQDIFRARTSKHTESRYFLVVAFLLGCSTMLAAFTMHTSVVSLALSSVSVMAGGLAPVMLIRTLTIKHTDFSLWATVVAGTLVSLLWVVTGLNTYINEAAPGFAFALAANYIAVSFAHRER